MTRPILGGWSSARTAIQSLLIERQQQRALPPLANSKAKKAGGGKSERQLIENRYSHYVPLADLAGLGKQTFRNVEVTGAARLLRAASSDRRERGRPPG